jgi:hypothetical protein
MSLLKLFITFIYMTTSLHILFLGQRTAATALLTLPSEAGCRIMCTPFDMCLILPSVVPCFNQ